MSEIERMKAELAKVKAEAQAKTQELVETARLKAQINLYSNENLLQVKAKNSLLKETTEKLKQLETACETIVADMPIHDARTKQNRKWNPSRQYGLGNQIAILSGILSGIQYSTQQHKEQMLAFTGLDEDLIENTLEAFGQTAYYSSNYDVVVDEQPYDFESLKNNIALIENILELNLDKVKLTESMLRNRFEVARVRAERAKEEVVKDVNHGLGTLINTAE